MNVRRRKMTNTFSFSPRPSFSTSPPHPSSLSPSDRNNSPHGSCSPFDHDPSLSPRVSWAPRQYLDLWSSCKFYSKSEQVLVYHSLQGWQASYSPLSSSAGASSPPPQSPSPPRSPTPPCSPSLEAPPLHRHQTPLQQCLCLVLAGVQVSQVLEPSSPLCGARYPRLHFALPLEQVLRLVAVVGRRLKMEVQIPHCMSLWVQLLLQEDNLWVGRALGDLLLLLQPALLVEMVEVLCLMKIQLPFSQLEEAHCRQPLVAELGPDLEGLEVTMRRRPSLKVVGRCHPPLEAS